MGKGGATGGETPPPPDSAAAVPPDPDAVPPLGLDKKAAPADDATAPAVEAVIPDAVTPAGGAPALPQDAAPPPDAPAVADDPAAAAAGADAAEASEQPAPSANAPTEAAAAPAAPVPQSRKPKLLSIDDAKAILAEPFDEEAEADRPLPESMQTLPDGAKAPLEGVLSVFLTGTTLEIVGAAHLTGADRDPAMTSAFVDRSKILEDIQFRGAISDFYNYRAAITASDAEQVLLKANDADIYGDGNNFELAVSSAPLEQWAAIDAELERRKARDDKIALRKLAEKSLPKNKIAHKFKPWASLGSEAEVEQLNVAPRRERIVLRIERPRQAFGTEVTLSDKDAQEIHAQSSTAMELRPFKDPNFDCRRRLMDCAVQAVPVPVDAYVHASGNPPRNNACQYTPLVMDPKEATQQQQTPEYAEFLERVRGDMELCLLQNTVIDVCADDFERMEEEEAIKGHRSGKPINEIMSFMDIRHCKDMSVSCLRWHPHHQRRNAGVVAVSLISKQTFKETVQTFGRPSEFAILVWSFGDLIHPEMVLESPFRVMAFDINPAQPDIVVGGCYNGQIVLWHVTEESMAGGANTGIEDEHRDVVVTHKCLSTIETSHSSPVTQLQWLPGWEITSKGGLVTGDAAGGACNFFATCAADGKVNFWDCRVDHQKKKGRKNDDPLDREWKPTYTVPLLSIAGNDLACHVLEFDTRIPGDFYIGSFDGEVMSGNFIKPDGEDNPDFTTAISQPHAGPVVALARSPFFADILLSVGDWSFHLWKIGTPQPIFTSAFCDERYTVGAWSPTRPAVIFLGLADGSIQCWDLLDRSHEAAINANVCSTAIRSLSFNTVVATDKSQLLAVGDDEAMTRINEVPSTLRKPVSGERALMEQFLDTQLKKLRDIESRQELRDARQQVLEEEARLREEAEAKAKEAAEAGKPPPAAEGQMADELAEEERAYEALERKLKEQLGLVKEVDGAAA